LSLTLPDRTPIDIIRTLNRRRMMFAALFFVGTTVAFIGWFVDVKHLNHLPLLYKHAAIIAVVGHALQVIGTFGLLLTPDYQEDDVS
jgi:hypothetical protein